VLLSNSLGFQKVMQKANDCISPFAATNGFINHVIRLGFGRLTMHAKQAHLRGTKKYIGPGCRGSLGYITYNKYIML
jgi:hypothetical protein